MFHLRKWYLDCTAESGETAIVYRAELRWRVARLSWGGLLHKLALDQPTVQRSTFRPDPAPELDQDGIRVADEILAVAGTWVPDAPSHDAVLLENDDGRIRWTCHAPSARCRMTISGRPIEGRGYAELLVMTIPPWKLPIRELRWGRWLAEDDSLVWIDWRGEQPLSLILARGAPVVGRVEDESGTVEGSANLRLDQSGVLREGELGATVLRDVPVIGRRIPPAIARTHETKWISRGVTAGGCEGWAVHERVCFGH